MIRIMAALVVLAGDVVSTVNLRCAMFAAEIKAVVDGDFGGLAAYRGICPHALARYRLR
jgi:hypothetical protein